MSDNWLQLIPSNPSFQPSAEAAKHAEQLFASFVPDADEVSASFKNSVEFFHPGANWSGVKCPSCGAEAELWWVGAMQHGAETQFQDLVVTTPCCGSRVSLNDLQYVWPAAFGRFVLEALNPNIKDITINQEQLISSCIGCGLRKVWVHI